MRIVTLITAWIVSKYEAFPGPYFPVFGLNTGQRKLRIWTTFTQWLNTMEIVVSEILDKSATNIFTRIICFGIVKGSSQNFTSNIKRN